MRHDGVVTRSLLAAVALVMFAGCEARPQPGDPLPGLTKAQRALFDEGRQAFNREFEPATGLGPLFNAPSCGECHEDPVAGGVGDEIERHATRLRPDGVCDALADRGGPVIQAHVTPALRDALGIDEEPVPPGATATGLRTTPPLFGLGLLDAVPDPEILAYADPDDRDGDGVSGRPNRFTDGRIGRFGRKAFVPTLREFNEGAFLFEQGITTPGAPQEETIAGVPLPPGVDPVADPEIDRHTLEAVDAFVRLLAPPAPARRSLTIRRGERAFRSIGCATCHVPTLRVVLSAGAPVRRHVEAWTDLLLHDMGPDLADICLGLATPSEFRTAPLMGLRLRTSFLHDGRAKTIEEAVRLHGGEGTGARSKFDPLNAREKKAILQFLKSL
jgi:CxxC motif-containing protein (DUF1111 family)